MTKSNDRGLILENIRYQIQQKNLKVEYLAKEIGVSQGELSKILNGQRKHFFVHLPAIAEALEIDFNQLFEANIGPANSRENVEGTHEECPDCLTKSALIKVLMNNLRLYEELERTRERLKELSANY